MGDNTSEEIDFQALFNAVPDLYWAVVPGQFRVAAVSAAFLAATGTRREDIVGKPLFEVFPADPNDPASKDNVNSLRASLERVQEWGREDALAEQRYPVPRSNSDGDGFEERYWNATNTPVFDKDGQLKYILHRTEDVTEQVRLRQKEESRQQLETHAQKVEADLAQSAHELKRLNEHLRFAQEVAKLGSWELHIEDNHRIWSEEVYRILGLSRDAVQQGVDSATLIEKVVHPDDRQMLREMRERLNRGENVSEIEHRIVRPDGQVRDVAAAQELASVRRDVVDQGAGRRDHDDGVAMVVAADDPEPSDLLAEQVETTLDGRGRVESDEHACRIDGL
ncbi:MAG: PAS domain S-box protein, partial [Proteobacteria bacterium]|nr:PAS domain S-box protein [Pseudomonadota bacterium]